MEARRGETGRCLARLDAKHDSPARSRQAQGHAILQLSIRNTPNKERPPIRRPWIHSKEATQLISVEPSTLRKQGFATLYFALIYVFRDRPHNHHEILQVGLRG